MSEQEQAAPQAPAPALSFDKVEFDQPVEARKCAGCSQPITDQYYEVNHVITCAPCHDGLITLHGGGAGPARFARALGFGAVGAAVGAALWMTVTHLTGYEIGFIAIVVGLIVGRCVHVGARGRGGWLYQLMAVLLTYLAIVATYVPVIVKSMHEAQREAARQKNPSALVADPGEPPPAWLTTVVTCVLVAGIALAAPFLAGLQNILGLLIIGFGLHQAWRMNKRRQLEISGPYRITPPAATADPASAIAPAS